MKDIRIGPRAQGAVVLGVLGAVIALVVSQIPELRRYLKVRGM
jgi:hypothetical protein